MAAPEVDVIRWGRERARTGRWRGSPTVAVLTPMPGAPALSLAFVRRCLDTLRARGFTGVVTAALSPAEQTAFLAAGFSEAQRLHLLVHDLTGLPAADPAPGHRLRRALGRDAGSVTAALEVDNAAFPPFWHLDEAGLDEAIRATPRARFVLASDPGAAVVGYAVTGRAGRSGYLQRLAVAPHVQGRGLGAALVVDGLRWLRRWRAERCLVNTQLGNTAALHLYERLGFRRLPQGLSVLAAGEVDVS